MVVCASGISQVRRRRYLWASWPMSGAPGVSVEETPHTWKIGLEATLPDPKDWVEPGWRFVGDSSTRLPTFMRAIPKKKETYLPAGILNTPADARRRWAAHKWRYPPYQYKREFCFRSLEQPRRLRVASAEEREILMFLGPGATRFASTQSWLTAKLRAWKTNAAP